jgi:TetR/AcrR family transcriptional regulator, transcriptional repressor for nem operon
MGRTREFDDGEALAGAMEVFRRRGYAAASIKDLEVATGLKSGSIYHSYRDKSGLFAAAFAHYNEVVLRGRLARYAPQKAGLDGLRELFLTLLTEPGGGSFGCLITNSAIEFGGDGELPPAASEGLQILARTFEACLGAAAHGRRGRGGFTPKVDAARLLALYQGILVLIRAGWKKHTLRRLINSEFSHLRRRYS